MTAITKQKARPQDIREQQQDELQKTKLHCTGNKFSKKLEKKTKY